MTAENDSGLIAVAVGGDSDGGSSGGIGNSINSGGGGGTGNWTNSGSGGSKTDELDQQW